MEIKAQNEIERVFKKPKRKGFALGRLHVGQFELNSMTWI